MKPESKNERDLFRIMSFSTALGFGALAAFLCSLRDITRDPTLELSYKTVVAFVIGAFCGWLVWRVTQAWVKKRRAESGE